MKSEIIFEDWSPVCNIQAFVEKTERAYYFYLWINPGSEEADIKACWICNRIKAPEKLKLQNWKWDWLQECQRNL